MNNLFTIIFAGLPFVYPDYRDKPVSEVANKVRDFCEHLELLGINTDWTADADTACLAAFDNEALRKVNELWWLTYHQQREDSNLPSAQPEGTWEP